MTTRTITVYADETDPDTLLAWSADSTTLRDLTAWTLAVEVIDRATWDIVHTKTDGLTAGDGTGSSNVNIAWTAAELADLTVDVRTSYWIRVTATNGNERAVFTVDNRGTLPTLVVIAAPTEAS